MIPVPELARETIPVNMEGIPKRRDRRVGRCYELAGRFQQDNQGWILVHADLYQSGGPYAGAAIDHAFVEHEGVVFDPVLAKTMPLPEYYAVYGVTHARKFDARTAAGLLLKENHWGPWGDPGA